MATLHKNGVETARFETLKSIWSFRSNGKVLRQQGFGWKLVHFKPGKSSKTLLATLESAEVEQKTKRPLYWAWKKQVISEFGINVRWRYLTLLELHPDDIDGIWSQMDDVGHRVDFEVLAELERMRQAALAEQNEAKKQEG
jgi:hypothetical protein